MSTFYKEENGDQIEIIHDIHADNIEILEQFAFEKVEGDSDQGAVEYL